MKIDYVRLVGGLLASATIGLIGAFRETPMHEVVIVAMMIGTVTAWTSVRKS